ncbi:MAG: hypothetical protein GX660_07675, partial [Clostridiaceae bacterium]|nr:hypothetical protein [Clostridiaceae bacterium]
GTSIKNPIASKVSYTYDDYNNRAKMTVDGKFSTVYAYDKNNRLTTETRTPVTITSTNLPEKVTYTYDNNGNTKSRITVKGSEASPVSKTEAKYDYDGFNQLKKVTEGSHVYAYSYSGDGLRYQKTIDGATTYQIWDGQKIAAEMNSSGTITNKYIRGINLIYASDAGGNKKH